MSILENQLSSIFGLNGKTPDKLPGSNPLSTLHFESSINNKPFIQRPPSNLDLDGLTPKKYLENPPK